MAEPKPDLKALFGAGKSLDETALRVAMEDRFIAFIASANLCGSARDLHDDLRAHLELTKAGGMMAEMLAVYDKYPRIQDPELLRTLRETAVKMEDSDLRYRAELCAEQIRAAYGRGLSARPEKKEMIKILRETIAFGRKHSQMLESGEMETLTECLARYLAQK